jgi:type II secretory pathway pseudopilin PulG
MSSKRGQAGVELMITIAMILIIFLGILSLSSQQSTRSEITQNNLEAQKVLHRISTSINQVYLAGDGVTKTVWLPTSLDSGKEYNLTIYPSSHKVVLVWRPLKDTRAISAGILPGNITGTIINFTGPINISNNKEVVSIE